MNKIFFSLLLISSSLSAIAQTNVVQIGSGEKLPKNYITYFLPKTELLVTVDVTKKVYKAGRFANYAKRLLELPNVIAEDSVSFEISGVDIYDNAVPDSTKHFAVEINRKSVAYKIAVNESGVVEGINCNNIIVENTIPRNTDFVAETITDLDYSVLNEDVLNAQTEEKMAIIVAKQIIQIRESRMELMSGEADNNYDGEALSRMLDNLNEAEVKLTRLFTGTVDEYRQQKSYKIMPNRDFDKMVLFRFSPILGIVEADDYSGYPITIEIDDLKIPHDFTNIKKTKTKGIFYNVVGSAMVSLFDLDKRLVYRRVEFPQFGYSTFLSAKIFNQSDIAIEFTKYGTIQTIK